MGAGLLAKAVSRDGINLIEAQGVKGRKIKSRINIQSQSQINSLPLTDRSHALRGNAAGDAPRSALDAKLVSCAMVTRKVTECIPTQSVGTNRFIAQTKTASI